MKFLKALFLTVLLSLGLSSPSIAQQAPASMVGVLGMSKLRTLPAAQIGYANIQLLGYRTIGDGGQGTFVYNGSSTCTDNGGTLIQAIGGCYQRQVTNAYNPQQFGAYCDNSHNDLTVFNAFFAAIPNGSTVQLPNSLCLVNDTINVNQSVTILCPSSGGFNMTTVPDADFGFLMRASNISFIGSEGCLVNGPRTPVTGADFVVHNRAFEVLGVSGTYLNDINISGVTITNWKDAAIYAQYVSNALFNDNIISSISWGGIVCQACTYANVSRNRITWIASSNGPGSTSLPTGTRTNAYGISFTDDGFGVRTLFSQASNNYVDEVPTWHCFDSHAGQVVAFRNNTCTNAQTGVQITTDGATLPALDIDVSGNNISCAALNSPIYPGGPSTSVGGAGIFASGVSTSVLANRVKIASNTVSSCGSSDSAATLAGAITVSNIQNLDLTHNIIIAGRYRGIISYNEVLGAMTANQFLSLVAGPLASGNILIDIEGASSQLLLSQHWGNSSGSEGYKIVAQGGSFSVNIARDNIFYNLSSLYDGTSASNRIDLGATAP